MAKTWRNCSRSTGTGLLAQQASASASDRAAKFRVNSVFAGNFALRVVRSGLPTPPFSLVINQSGGDLRPLIFGSASAVAARGEIADAERDEGEACEDEAGVHG